MMSIPFAKTDEELDKVADRPCLVPSLRSAGSSAGRRKSAAKGYSTAAKGDRTGLLAIAVADSSLVWWLAGGRRGGCVGQGLASRRRQEGRRVPQDSFHLDGPMSQRAAPPTRAERGKLEIIPARRAHAAFSAASESRAVKRPFDRSGLGSLFYSFRECGAGSQAARSLPVFLCVGVLVLVRICCASTVYCSAHACMRLLCLLHRMIESKGPCACLTARLPTQVHCPSKPRHGFTVQIVGDIGTDEKEYATAANVVDNGLVSKSRPTAACTALSLLTQSRFGQL